MPQEPIRYYRNVCECGHVTEGTCTFGEHWVKMMTHVVQSCPLVSKQHGRKIMAMINRDNLGEFDSDVRL